MAVSHWVSVRSWPLGTSSKCAIELRKLPSYKSLINGVALDSISVC